MTNTSWIALGVVFLAVMFAANQANSTITFGANSPITASGSTIGIDIDTDGGLDDLTAGIGLSNCLTEGDVKVFDISESDWDCGIRVAGAGGSFVVQLDDVTTVGTTTVADFNDTQFIITETPAEEANISIEDIFVFNTGDTITGDLLIDNQSDLRLGEPDGAGVNYIAIEAPATIASNITCTLEDDSTPFDPCISAGGGGDVSAVGPGHPTGATFTDGVASTGSIMFVWEGTGIDTNELTISAPANPAVDQTFTFPDDNLVDDDLIVGNAAGTFEYKALPDCDATTDHGLQYDQTTNAFSCDSTADDDSPEAGDYAAASIDGDDVNTNIGGRSLTLTAASPDTLDLDPEIYTDVKGFVILDPVDADDIESLWRPSNFSVTIVSIYCETDVGTVTLDLLIDDGTPTGVNGSNITCTTSGVDDATLAGDTGLDADERLDMAIGTVTTATRLSVMWEYTIND